jgi:hypothetical protein
LRHANNLTNAIYEKNSKDVQSKYTQMRTIVEQEEFTINYNNRIVATIYKLQKHKNVEPNDIIKPIKIRKLLYMPAELELIDIYHTMYTDPSSDMEAVESELFSQVAERKESGILGASEHCKELRKELMENIKIHIVTKFINNKFVLIGPWAYNLIKVGKKDLCADIEKIQVISNINPNELKTMLSKFIATFTQYNITMREQDLHIPKDFRTTRFTYYFTVGNVEKPFLDLFNCTRFEIIPFYKIDNIYVAYKWVMLRFLFIDLWIVRVIKSLGLISSIILDKKIMYIWKLIEFFRDNHPDRTLEYTGTFIDYIVDKKMMNQQEKRFNPYMPIIHLKNNTSLRTI